MLLQSEWPDRFIPIILTYASVRSARRRRLGNSTIQSFPMAGAGWSSLGTSSSLTRVPTALASSG
jgi:hypothetical protein